MAVGLLVRRRRQGQRPATLQLLRDTLRWAAFLGAFSGVTVFVDELIAMLGGKKRTQAWRGMAAGVARPALLGLLLCLVQQVLCDACQWPLSVLSYRRIAGLAAGPTLLLTGSRETHTSLALYIFLRGLALLVRCGNLPTAAPWKRKLLAPTRWQHGDVALMALSTMQVGGAARVWGEWGLDGCRARRRWLQLVMPGSDSLAFVSGGSAADWILLDHSAHHPSLLLHPLSEQGARPA